MGREYDDNQSLQQKIMDGANKLADNVAPTLGPRGRNVLLQEKGRTPFDRDWETSCCLPI